MKIEKANQVVSPMENQSALKFLQQLMPKAPLISKSSEIQKGFINGSR